jgi:hypothetical protein
MGWAAEGVTIVTTSTDEASTATDDRTAVVTRDMWW